jgi:hypothetical protein
LFSINVNVSQNQSGAGNVERSRNLFDIIIDCPALRIGDAMCLSSAKLLNIFFSPQL